MLIGITIKIIKCSIHFTNVLEDNLSIQKTINESISGS